ncbi:MAG: STN domain-containing protein [Pirellulales bacterium]|nr:STN domain-containing protein [Pirellulales bacterium]
MMSGRLVWISSGLALAAMLVAIGQHAAQSVSAADPFADDAAATPPAVRAEAADPFSAPLPSAKSAAKPAAPKVPAARKVAKAVEAPKPTSGRANDPTGVAAIERALLEKTELEFVETPLADVVEYLKDQHDVAIELDRRAIEETRRAAPLPVSLALKNVSLESALHLMLRDLDLTWTIADEVLLITTPEEAESMLVTRLYDVADLVTYRDERDQPWEDYDSLIDMITSTVDAATSDEVGGAGTVSGGTFGTAKILVVRQTYPVHREIAELLAEIREIAARHAGDGQPPRKPRSQLSPGMRGMGMGGMGMGGGFGGSSPDAKNKPLNNGPAGQGAKGFF